MSKKEKPSYRELERKVKELEEKLCFARKKADVANDTKMEFMANMSHELRTPMHAILNYSRFGVNRHKEVDREKLCHYFSQILTAGNRMMKLLTNLLELLDYDAGKKELTLSRCNIEDCANEAIAEFKPVLDEKNIELKIFEKTKIEPLVCDYSQIRDVFKHLLSNAVKFSDKGKTISIIFESEFIPDYDQGDKSVPTAIRISVIDQGIGIPKGEFSLLFNRFTQSSWTNTGAGGIGLGLAICSEVLKAHGGKIWAKNNPEGGAIFIFLIPYRQTQNARKALED